MKYKRLLLIFVGAYLLLTTGAALYFFLFDDAKQLVAKLGNHAASVFTLPEMGVALYDESFLDPHSAAFRHSGGDAIWTGKIDVSQRTDPVVHLIAITRETGWLEVTCSKATAAIGIHFWGMKMMAGAR